MGMEKTRKRPKSKRTMPKCPKCGKQAWKRKGLIPINTTGKHNKGWTGPGNKEKYHPEAVARLFTKRYNCQNCGHYLNYGNAGRPIK